MRTVRCTVYIFIADPLIIIYYVSLRVVARFVFTIFVLYHDSHLVAL